MLEMINPIKAVIGDWWRTWVKVDVTARARRSHTGNAGEKGFVGVEGDEDGDGNEGDDEDEAACGAISREDMELAEEMAKAISLL
jgi:hypothetical protein